MYHGFYGSLGDNLTRGSGRTAWTLESVRTMAGQELRISVPKFTIIIPWGLGQRKLTLHLSTKGGSLPYDQMINWLPLHLRALGIQWGLVINALCADVILDNTPMPRLHPVSCVGVGRLVKSRLDEF